MSRRVLIIEAGLWNFTLVSDSRGFCESRNNRVVWLPVRTTGYPVCTPSSPIQTDRVALKSRATRQDRPKFHPLETIDRDILGRHFPRKFVRRRIVNWLRASLNWKKFLIRSVYGVLVYFLWDISLKDWFLGCRKAVNFYVWFLFFLCLCSFSWKKTKIIQFINALKIISWVMF